MPHCALTALRRLGVVEKKVVDQGTPGAWASQKRRDTISNDGRSKDGDGGATTYSSRTAGEPTIKRL